jgi:ribosome-associated toxin RatA of RatAB toxin-antitoxin module
MKRYLVAWIFLGYAGIIFFPGLALCAGAPDDLQRRLAAGEIIATTEKDPGTSLIRGEMTGVIDAPPEIVWQVITDVNNFKYFMPRTKNSMAVPAEKIPLILQNQPKSAKELEALVGPTPADPASYHIPGGKYSAYHYSDLQLPFPCSNRWYIIKGVYDETAAAQHRYHSSWSLVIGNLRENSGEWILEPFGTDQTKAIYRLNTDPGGAIPSFLVNKGTCSTMPQIIKAVRERAARLCALKQP